MRGVISTKVVYVVRIADIYEGAIKTVISIEEVAGSARCFHRGSMKNEAMFKVDGRRIDRVCSVSWYSADRTHAALVFLYVYVSPCRVSSEAGWYRSRTTSNRQKIAALPPANILTQGGDTV